MYELEQNTPNNEIVIGRTCDVFSSLEQHFISWRPSFVTIAHATDQPILHQKSYQTRIIDRIFNEKAIIETANVYDSVFLAKTNSDFSADI